MRRFPQTVLLASFLCSVTGSVLGDTPLTVHAFEASTQLTPRAPGAAQTRLPSLQFSIVATINCAADTKAQSITVSAIDTHQHIDLEATPNAEAVEASLHLPANQIAPVSAAEFCVIGAPSDEEGLLVPGIATAQVSLRCLGESTTSVHFAAVSLPLRLLCHPDENQRPSADK